MGTVHPLRDKAGESDGVAYKKSLPLDPASDPGDGPVDLIGVTAWQK